MQSRPRSQPARLTYSRGVLRVRRVPVPENVLAGLASFVSVFLIALWFAPKTTSRFYEAAVQVIPVFLVALAVEQTLARSLGTESAYVREAREKTQADFEPPPEYDVAVRA